MSESQKTRARNARGSRRARKDPRRLSPPPMRRLRGVPAIALVRRWAFGHAFGVALWLVALLGAWIAVQADDDNSDRNGDDDADRHDVIAAHRLLLISPSPAPCACPQRILR